MSSSESLVSVILPVYNAQKYISDTLDSVLSQTYHNLEVIIINDKSKDSSFEIISEYTKFDNRLKIIDLEVNSGVAVARNTGINASSGRFIAFIDSDDIWKPSKIEEQVNDLLSNDACFSFSAIEIINGDGLIIKKSKKVKRHVDYKYLLKNTIIATSSVVIDRYKISKIEMPNLRSGQDYATWLDILRNDIVAIGLNMPLVQYRISPNSLSRNKFKSIKQVWKIQRDFEHIVFYKRLFNIIGFILNALRKKIF